MGRNPGPGEDPGQGGEGLGRKLLKPTKLFQLQKFTVGQREELPALVIQLTKEHHRPENHLEP